MKPIILAGLCALALTGQAHADCNDPPAPGVKWANCDKAGAVLNGADLQ